MVGNHYLAITFCLPIIRQASFSVRFSQAFPETPRSLGGARLFIEALLLQMAQFLFAHWRPTFVSPSRRTMLESPSATAAKMERPSDDQDTRRAMNVGRSPKSVI